MRVQIFPDFTKSNQQRIKGLLTPQQVLVGTTIILPLMIAAQVNGLLCVPLVLGLYAFLVFWAAAPQQGSMKAMLWVYRGVARWANRSVENHTAFTHTVAETVEARCLRIEDEQGAIVLSTELEVPTKEIS